jgi:hypothetical protein
MRALCLATILSLATAMPAAADIRIKGSPGGEIGKFVELFDRVRASGQRVIIDGPCFSACTLVLSLVPQSRICVTRRAVLGFHAARYLADDGRLVIEPRASAIVLKTYPPAIRAWITRRGGLKGRLLTLRGHTLATMLHVCR